MNDEVNFCSQCGAKINSDAKFCSNCGYDLQSSSTQTQLDKAIKTQTPLDKTIKVEVTNATVEKGFETVGKGVKATGATLKKGFKAKGKGATEIKKGIGDNYDFWGPVIAIIIGFLLLVVGLEAR